MAYGNSNTRTGTYGTSKPAAPVAESTARKFEVDPNEVGIGYEKQMKSGDTYIALTVVKDIPAGAKISLFPNNKVKNRTEKTPTHKLKLSVRKPQA